MFAVVEFPDTHEVEVVPLGWLSGSKCYWPSKAKDIRKLIQLEAPCKTSRATFIARIIKQYGFEKLLLKKIEILHSELNQQKLLLMQVFKHVSAGDADFTKKDLLPALPISCDEDLEDWEEYLKDKDNYYYAVCKMLKRISLRNFMCHEHFVIDLNPRINFITGENGSGKSAIVAALMIGLGQNAHSTYRGKALKDFIKEGKHSAMIEICFLNSGSNEFKQDIYGIELTVVRTITSTKTSYSLKDKQGQKHPLNRIELKNLLMHFNIQPENPLCILSQDVARTFLLKFDPKSLYSLFSEATLLNSLNNTFYESKEISEKTLRSLMQKRQEIEKMEGEVQLAKKQKYLAISIQKRHDIEEALRGELACAEVKGIEGLIDDLKRKKDKLDSETNQITKKIQGIHETLWSLNSSEFQKELASCEEKLCYFVSQRGVLREKLIKAEEQHSNLKKQLLENKCSIGRKEENMKQIQIMIHDNRNVIKTEYQRKNDELRCLKIREKEEKLAMNAAKTHLDEMENSLVQYEFKLASLNRDVEKMEKHSRQMHTKIEQLKKDRNPAGIDKWMSVIVDEIDKAHKQNLFTEKPKGPLCSYIQVIDAFWAPAVEYSLKRHLSIFCLNNEKDFNVFNRIVEKCVPSDRIPDVMITKFLHKVHDFSRSEVRHPKYTSFLRQLKCSDPDILNYLIDEVGIEQILLVPDLNETYKLCEKTANVPKNLKRCLTPDGDILYPSPEYRFYAGRMGMRSHHAPQLKIASASNELLFSEQNRMSLLKDLASLKREKGEIEESIEKMSKDKNEIRKSIDSLQNQLKTNKLRQIELKTIIDSEAPINIESYTKDLNSLNDDKKRLVEKNLVIQKSIVGIEDFLNQENKKMEQLCQDFGELSARKNQILESIDSIEKCVHEYDMCLIELKRKLSSFEEERHEVMNQIDCLEKKIESRKIVAKQLCGEQINWEEVRSLEIVEMHMNRIKEELGQLESLREETHSEMTEQDLRDASKQLKTKKRFFSALYSLNEKYNEKLNEDIESVRSSENSLIQNSKRIFSQILKRRNLQGRFHVDTEREILRISVSSINEEKGDGGSVIGSLSGGEKSFTTAAFIMTVWSSMTVPLFVMDEIDVFMDVITRETIFKMLLEFATSNSAQFLFLTPNDLSGIDTTIPEVTLHRVTSTH